ncbi:MAG: hypothetical protein GY884_35830, partial [Proteobacteria bacterium]|nr:hypothetical protein [Pseudomonadota bacterium]
MSARRDMDAMFGQARSLIAASEEPSVMSEELSDLLFEAHGLDPRRYAEEWVPYLTALDCWSRQGGAFADLEEFARWHEVLHPIMGHHTVEMIEL